MGMPISPHWIRLIAIVGIFVCGGWTLAGLWSGLYKEAAMYAFFTAANVFAYWQNRR